MPDLLTQSFAPLLLAFQPCFTQPSFRSFWALVCAWILCSGRRSLTRVIQAAQLSQFKHYCSFHRFFSKARWNLDELGHCVLPLLLPFCSQLLVAAVDDTLARKSGRRIWGADMHHDPLRSTRARPFFSFGHNWVVFSLHISFPFAPHKHWALPILVRLYRKKRKNKLAPGRRGKWERKQTGQASPKQYRTRPQLALEMIQIVAGWVPDRLLHVTADSEYGGRAISRHLPANAHLISRMTMKAALYDVPRRIPAVADAHARRASVCPAPCRWPRILLRRGSKPSCSSTASASAFGTNPWMLCGTPAPARDCCVSSWCAILRIDATTTASSRRTAHRLRPTSSPRFLYVGPWKFAFAT